MSFSAAAASPDVRILEYSGLNPTSPLDVTAAAVGNSATSSSGTATTTSASELLVGANMVYTSTNAPGAGFTRRIITSPDGDIAEDQIVTATGSYQATAPLSGAGPWLMQMATFSASPSAVDTTPPTAPSNLTATAASASQINLSWTASTDNVGVTGYLVERCSGAGCTNFAQIGTPTSTSFSDTGLTVNTSYSYRVRATDAAGNLSGYSNTASATTSGQDTTPPTAPSNLTATAASASQINLSWTASTDNVGVTGYLVERCSGAGCTAFAQIGTPTSTTFSDTGLTANTSYSYRVRATDAAGNLSAYSNTATATTPGQDTQPPTAPASLTATAVNSSQINLSWTASTDNVGVTGYLVERCSGAGCTNFAQIGTPTSTTFSDTGLAASTSYSYRVRATDAAGNLSAYSNTATATTTGTTGGTIKFIQGNYAVPSSATTVTVTFTAAQTAGNLNVVVVGWNDTTHTVSSVTDSSSNTYVRAVGPTVGGGISQSIYYAKSIAGAAANANTVTVTFSAAATAPDIRILEYSGLNTTAPLDVTAAASGSGTSVSSGSATTTSANELILGATTVSAATSGVGSGFTKRIHNGPGQRPRRGSDRNRYWKLRGHFHGDRRHLGRADGGLLGIALGGRHDATDGTVQLDGDGGERQPDQPVMDCLHGQCRGHRLPGGAMLGGRMHQLRPDRHPHEHELFRHGPDGQHQLQLSREGNGRGRQPQRLFQHRQCDHLWTRHDTTDGTVQLDGDGGERQPDQPVMDCLHRQCRGHRLPGGAMLGGRMHQLRPDRHPHEHDLFRHGPDGQHQLQLSREGNGRGRQPQRLFQHRHCDHLWTRHDATDGTVQLDGDGGERQSDQPVMDCLHGQCRGHRLPGGAMLRGRMHRFAQIGTPTSTTFSDTGLTANTSYSYRVRATDAAGNLSAYSNIATATTTGTTGGTIKFIQGNYQVPHPSATSVAVTYTAAQSAGDLNVVIVGWNDATTTVSSVTDTNDNTYTLAVGPTVLPGPPGGGLSQAIYYAKNIASAAANGNTVTVSFSAAAVSPDVRILEYSGLNPTSPLDVTAAAVGNSATSSSGTATTTSASELLVGANMVYTSTTGPGAGFTRRIITSPDGDIAEDQIVTATGSYQATAPLSRAGPWIMQMAGFKP